MFSDILLQVIDPKEPLNNKDQANLLMNDNFKKFWDLSQNIKEELRLEREHNKSAINAVVTGFCNHLQIVEESVIKYKTCLTHTAKDLKQHFNEKAKNFDNVEEKASDVELKLKTYFEYQQEDLV